ncbi:MAG TPA: methyltransferase [Xanthobacteraceae bacterium]|nr:methyltransferase [Xanthobacteraceae bacterium]
MNSIQFSSGDLVADRRADYAEMLFAEGDLAAAADLLRDALALAPRWAAGWFRLGEMRQAAGEPDAAVRAWREALRLDPADRLGATLRLSLVAPAEAIVAPPSLFVETLFDQYAEKFDASLVGKLGYCVPQLLCERILASGQDRFAHVLDLGCGTGLMGERLRRRTSFLEGVDISAAMLKKAAEKRIYDRLEKADLAALEPGDSRADLICAADVFIYLGTLDGIAERVKAMLSPGGLFAFSVESHDGPEPTLLRSSRRFAHSEGYLRELLSRNGFAIVSLSGAIIRHDGGAPIEGLLVVAQLGAARDQAVPHVVEALELEGIAVR